MIKFTEHPTGAPVEHVPLFVRCENTLSFPVKVVFYNKDGDAFPEVYMESLPSARVYANAVLELVPNQCVRAEIISSEKGSDGKLWGDAEVMRTCDMWDRGFLRFPFADIARTQILVDVHGSAGSRIGGLCRHFQMAGAVDQARVERLAVFMRAGKSIAAQEQFRIDFLDPEAAVARVQQGHEYRHVNQGGVSDAELDVYRNSNQYADPIR